MGNRNIMSTAVCLAAALFVDVLIADNNISTTFAATYQNNRQGYDIGYPNDWQITEHFSVSTGTLFKPKLDTDLCKCTYLGVVAAPGGYHPYILDDAVRELRSISDPSLSMTNETYVLLAGLPAYQTIVRDDNGSYQTRIYTVAHDVLYAIIYNPHATTQLSTYQKMIDTFHIRG